MMVRTDRAGASCFPVVTTDPSDEGQPAEAPRIGGMRILPALAVVALLVAGCSPADPPASSTPPPVTTEAPVTSQAPATSAEATPSESEVPVPSTEPSGVETMTAPTAPPSETAIAGEPWTVLAAEVKEAADVSKLGDLPEDFRAFVTERVSTEDSSGCKSEITVKAYHPAGFVYGDEFAPGCGGAATVWGKGESGWGVKMAMQAVIPCAEFEANLIPKGAPGLQCITQDGQTVDY